MSGITTIQKIPGFDPAQYSQVVSDAKVKNISQQTVDEALLAAINSGKDFNTAIDALHIQNLPTLPAPAAGKGVDLATISGAVPSMGAGFLSLIAETSSEERRRSAEQRAMQTQIIADTIMEQADDMRTKAVVQLCMGIVTGTLSIAQGAIGMSMMSSGLKSMEGLSAAEQQTGQMLLGQQVASFNAAAGGVNGLLSTVSETVGGFMDASIKEKEAAIEQARSTSDSLKSLEDSMRELINKTLSCMDAIQSNTNQTRSKILG